MAIKYRKSSTKSPPILSHEFVIQNHADIVSCVAMIFVIGLMVQSTSPLAYIFVALHHNVSVTVNSAAPDAVPQIMNVVRYTYGIKDLGAIFFYFLIGIVMHAVIQEYILDVSIKKITRKLHLSKAKLSMFSESGQLLIFYVMSVLWGGDVIFRENYLFSLSSLWEGYPHDKMTFMFKFFFIMQMSYWLHCFPELYFQKVKREEWVSKIIAAGTPLFYIAGAYVLNFSRVGICLLVFHYGSEALFHAARIVDFVDKSETENKSGYMVANVVFVLVRLASIILAVLTFWYGLSLNQTQGLDFETGNFNIAALRLFALAAVTCLQAWLMWNFINLQLQKRREHANLQSALARKQKAETKAKGSKKKKDEKHREDDDLPEVDQNTRKALHQRKPKAEKVK